MSAASYLPKSDVQKHRQQPTTKSSVGGRAAIQQKLRGMNYAEGVAALSPRSETNLIQCKSDLGPAAGVHQAAAHGTRGAGGALPFVSQIQASFGKHDVSGVKANVGGTAKEACESMGAEAYASGNAIAFKGSPTLHTAAHEAAHIVQQRAGVSLSGGVGQVGDKYENHADAVADLVVQGKSAEGVLDQLAAPAVVGGRMSTSNAVQRRGLYKNLQLRGAQQRALIPMVLEALSKLIGGRARGHNNIISAFWKANDFPSHGYRMKLNGFVIDQRIVKDASGMKYLTDAGVALQLLVLLNTNTIGRKNIVPSAAGKWAKETLGRHWRPKIQQATFNKLHGLGNFHPTEWVAGSAGLALAQSVARRVAEELAPKKKPSTSSTGKNQRCEVLMKAWIPYSYIADPEALVTRAGESKLFHGDGHTDFGGDIGANDYRMALRAEFDFDGTSIRHLRTTGYGVGTTVWVHKNNVTGRIIETKRKQAALKYKVDSLTSRTIRMSMAGGNPLVLAGPDIDSVLTIKV